MSFVSVVAMENFITVVADKRMVDLETKAVKDENFKKIKKINESQFITCTGNAGVAEFIFSKFKYGNMYNLQLCAQQLSEEVKRGIDYKVANIQGVIGGRNEKNEFVLYSFSNKPDIEIVEYKPKNIELVYVILSGNEAETVNFSPYKKFEELYTAANVQSVKDVIRVQEDLNNLVADIDKTVNKNIMILKLV